MSKKRAEKEEFDIDASLRELGACLYKQSDVQISTSASERSARASSLARAAYLGSIEKSSRQHAFSFRHISPSYYWTFPLAGACAVLALFFLSFDQNTNIQDERLALGGGKPQTNASADEDRQDEIITYSDFTSLFGQALDEGHALHSAGIEPVAAGYIDEDDFTAEDYQQEDELYGGYYEYGSV